MLRVESECAGRCRARQVLGHCVFTQDNPRRVDLIAQDVARKVGDMLDNARECCVSCLAAENLESDCANAVVVLKLLHLASRAPSVCDLHSLPLQLCQ